MTKRLHGEITVPGDKSISHRSIMFGSLAKGTTRIRGFLDSADCRSTMNCFQQMGILIGKDSDGSILVNGKGMHGLIAPSSILYTGNSGTTTRLLSGILSAQPFTATINGDETIRKRPMKRIMEPLSLMGADIRSLHENDCAPLLIHGNPLHGISYATKTASAQVKSAILLAGLYADSPTEVTEPAISRNHSELMLQAFGASLQVLDKTVTLQPTNELYAQDITVPGDISSAAYFIVAGLITPDSEILIKNVGINPTRDGIIHVAKEMGGDITLVNERTICGEKTADLLVRSCPLHGTTIQGDIIPTLIDELPVIAILAAYANGTTIVKDAAELKVKECNRIDAVTKNLKAMGGDITPTDDGFIIRGGSVLHSSTIETFLDHRIAMSFAIADLIADGQNTYDHPEAVCISYPKFYEDLKSLQN